MKPSVLPLLFLLMFSAVSQMAAQSTYTQSMPSACKLSDYVCQQIPLVGGGYYGIVDDTSRILVGSEFYLNTGSGNVYGNITGVNEQPPFGTDGPFQLTFSLSGGVTGSVFGQLHFTKVGRWTLAIVESSAVTVN